MSSFSVSSKIEKEVVDLTNQLNSIVTGLDTKDGVLFLFVKHTTCSLGVADLDPGTDKDYLEAIEKMFPKGNYRHPHDPPHVGDHIMSSIIGPSVVLPIKNGSLDLGTWQSVVLVELNGPRDREIVYNVIE